MANSEAMKKRIDKMTLEQKLGMLICARAYMFHPEDEEGILELIKKRALGAIQIDPQWDDFRKKVLEAADYPILVVTDMESRAPGSQLPDFPLLCLAACGKKEYYQAFAKGVVRDAKKLGYNGNWGPVVDVLHGDAPCSISRKLSDDPMEVASITEEIAKIYHQNHFFSTGKHFPGSGKNTAPGRKGAATDSHMVESASMATLENLMENSFPPYKHLLEKGLLDCIMTRHAVFKNIDPQFPATVSKKINSIIRDMGFDGVAFTDSLSMSGIRQKYSQDVLNGMAIAAGHDIILPYFNLLTKDLLEILKKNYADGIITDERLDEAVGRVLRLQDFVAQTPENPTEFTEEDEKLLRNIPRDCITALTDEGISPALDTKDNKKVFVIIEEERAFDEEKGEINFSAWYSSKDVGAKIKETFPDAQIEYLPPLSNVRDHQRVLSLTKDNDEVILVTQCYTAAYLGTDCLTRRNEAILNAIIHTGKVSAVVHFGNPFAIKTLHHVPRKIFGYMMKESQGYAIDVLAGKEEAKGKLPFHIEFQ